MIDERQAELASLYAFDLLEGAARVQFETEMERDAELRAFVAQLRSTAGNLAHAAPTAIPPDALKQRILASTENRVPGGGEAIPFPRRSPFASIAPWALAAGFALCAGWFGSRYYLAQSENALLRSERELASVALKTAETKLEAERLASAQLGSDLVNLNATSKRELAQAESARTDAERRATEAQAELVAANDRLQHENDLARLKIATLASMLGNSPKAVAVAVWDPAAQRGVFTVDQLAANTPDQRYELWVIDKVPVSAGVFSVGADGKAKVDFKPTHRIQSAAKFAVSREKNDGLSSHANPSEVVMISE